MPITVRVLRDNEAAVLENVADDVFDHAIDPRFKATFAAIAAKALQDCDQRFLCDIVDARIAAHEVTHEVAHARQELATE